MIAQGLPSLGGALVAALGTPTTTLVPIATQQNAGWTASSGTAHAALAAVGGTRLSASTNGATALFQLG